MTTHRYGKGQLTVLGCFADRALSGALARWVAAESLPVDPWRAALEATQSHVACRTADGRTLHIIHNWSWQPSRYVLPASVTALGADTAALVGSADRAGRVGRSDPSRERQDLVGCGSGRSPRALRQAQGTYTGSGHIAQAPVGFMLPVGRAPAVRPLTPGRSAWLPIRHEECSALVPPSGRSAADGQLDPSLRMAAEPW